MKTKILADFQICISVRLINIIQKQKKAIGTTQAPFKPPMIICFYKWSTYLIVLLII